VDKSRGSYVENLQNEIPSSQLRDDPNKMSPRPIAEQELLRKQEEAAEKSLWVVNGNLIEERYRAFDNAPIHPVEKIFWKLAAGKNYVGRKDMLKNMVLGKYFFARGWDKEYISTCIDTAGGYMNRMNATAFRRFIDRITIEDPSFTPDPYGDDVVGYDDLIKALFEDLKIMISYERPRTSKANEHLLFDDFASDSSYEAEVEAESELEGGE
jgi:hypothetical protein